MKSFIHQYIDKINNLPNGKLNKEDILNYNFF